MKTQITLVQHNEDELENKRQHCKLRSPSFVSWIKTDIPQMSESWKHLKVRFIFSPMPEI
jgi:hypothetical protein